MRLIKTLLAEDDIDDQELFMDFLSHREDIFILPVVDDGVALISRLESQTDNELPDLIILDQNMPRQSGLQTLLLLKKNYRYKHIPVMVYSTYTDQHLINNSVISGASAVMQKPVTKEGYNKMIDDLLLVIQKEAADKQL